MGGAGGPPRPVRARPRLRRLPLPVFWQLDTVIRDILDTPSRPEGRGANVPDRQEWMNARRSMSPGGYGGLRLPYGMPNCKS